jgi:NAD(P)-dependent dehydrogenase (short-subunit alcohol dehydrogenase family)
MNKRVVLLTGSMGRLGSALCEKYYNDYFFVGVGRTKKSNFAHHFIQADINSDAEKIVAETLQKFKRIDVLVNNAAIYSIKPLREITGEQMASVFQTNVIAPHVLSNTVLNMFWKDRIERNKERNRNIINLSSISATNFYKGQGAYAPSKAALNHLTIYQSEEFKEYGIRVNAIAPTSFPSIISAEVVADAVVDIDRSIENGTITVVDKKGG